MGEESRERDRMPEDAGRRTRMPHAHLQMSVVVTSSHPRTKLAWEMLNLMEMSSGRN